jgi:hypothetical protein
MKSSGTAASRAAQPITVRQAAAAAGVTEYMRAFASKVRFALVLNPP